ncbi:MAG: sulfite exporter TauE/SafE family protein, partial [Actinomycetia bacterium]|nr:sulfite exporter TauE/SafE family protein [Actinomycetes bacterium]
ASRLQSNILLGIFGCFVLAMAYIIYKRNKKISTREPVPVTGDSLFGSTYYDPGLGRHINYDTRNTPYGFGASFFAGIASGLLGIGGGVIKVPTLNLLLGLPIKAAAATSNYMIGLTAAASSIIYIAQGYVNPFITSAVVIGVLAGGTLGSHAASRVKSLVIIRVIIVIFALIGINMLLRALGVRFY